MPITRNCLTNQIADEENSVVMTPSCPILLAFMRNSECTTCKCGAV